MDTVNLIYDYFPELTEEQRERFARLEGLYREWNEKDKRDFPQRYG